MVIQMDSIAEKFSVMENITDEPKQNKKERGNKRWD